MWQRHWNLTRDPFDGRRAAFVATPTHAEAVARLVHAIRSAGRSARLLAGAGSGKSMVLARALELTRSPTRRVSRATGPSDGPELFATLATGLGGKVEANASKSAAWRALAEAAKLCRWQGFHVVLAIDDCQTLEGGTDLQDLDRLEHLDPRPDQSPDHHSSRPANR